MSEIPKYQIGAAIIYSPREFYVLHERKEGNDNGEVNKVGIYGGQFDAEKDADLRNTASRELHEESGVLIPPEELSYEDFIHTLSERGGKQILSEVDIYSRGLPGSITEEQAKEMFRNSKIMTPKEVSAARVLGQLTSVASAAFGKVRLI